MQKWKRETVIYIYSSFMNGVYCSGFVLHGLNTISPIGPQYILHIHHYEVQSLCKTTFEIVTETVKNSKLKQFEIVKVYFGENSF